jgi:glycosyltransferase involved in cell wall biosynthesis
VTDRRKHYDVAFYVPWVGPLLASGAHGLATGGAETQIFLLSRALAGRGLRVCLLVFEIPGVHVPETVDGVDVVLRPPYKSAQGMVARVREAARIRAALASVDSDVFVTRAAGPHVGLVGLFAFRRKFVFSTASALDFDFLRQAPKRRDRALFALGLHLADDIVVQTEEQYRTCDARLRRAATLIRSLCEVSDEPPAEPDAFLWVGRYIGYKRPLEFVELARRVPEAHFRMVAASTPGAAETARIRQEVEDAASGTPNLEVLPSLPRPKVLELVRRAVAIVSTSEFEGMSNVLLEGWARGVPALVFSYDSDRIVARHNVGSVAGGSRERFAQHARDLWNARVDRSELAARCRAYIGEYHSPDRIAEQWARVLVPPPTLMARDDFAAEGAR